MNAWIAVGGNQMGLRDRFASITHLREPLAPHTHLRIGGPAEMFVTPGSREELSAIVAAASAEKVALRVLGTGSRLLVREQGVPGVVVRLDQPAFREVNVEGRRVRAGAGTDLFDAIAATARAGLGGLESLVGIPGTIGGAVRCNAGDRWGEIADFVRRVEVLDDRGQARWRERSELHFGEHHSNLDDPVILTAEFELEKDSAEAIERRLRKAWIHRKAEMPFSHQAAVRAFQQPRGYSAAVLIERAGLAKGRVGAAEVSERDANYVVAHPGTTSADVLQLIELVQGRVRDKCGVQLERELIVW
jgi:UDP-N-acetylmuramate dehydrogenase